MKILLVEDDWQISTAIGKSLAVSHAGIEVPTCKTEREFMESLPRYEEKPPHLFILDVMIQWDFPRPDAVPLPESARTGNGDFRMAGLRIYDQLKSRNALKGVPIIFHSIVGYETISKELGDRPSHVLIVSKSSVSIDDPALSIRSLFPEEEFVSAPPKNWWHRLFDALELKPGAFGFRVDLKKLPKK